MKPIEYAGWEGDKMSLGVLEGGGAPMLIIKTPEDCAYDRASTFCFENPEQVQKFINDLQPFTR